ncbi:hypothetical protein K0M31_017088 [Melipona bicolor]|uniref:Uncharacterized protein n=1 Tax=Melipona bicolor TaxID=60889 RepID=A0AA40KE53_9HYME|nr:hypothetical protein K0M31_017088 [Melipona bicolor]
MLGGYEAQSDYYPQWHQPLQLCHTQLPYGPLNVPDADSQSTYWGADSGISGGSSGAGSPTASTPPLIEVDRCPRTQLFTPTAIPTPLHQPTLFQFTLLASTRRSTSSASSSPSPPSSSTKSQKGGRLFDNFFNKSS